MPKSESIKELTVALIAVQSKLKPVERDGHANYGNFSTLAAVTEASRDLLISNGLAVVQLPTTLPDGSSGLETTLMHISGEWISGEMPLLLAKEDPQGQGSGITYARRYALSALLQIIQEDDDGQKATASKQQSQQNQAQRKSAVAPKPPCPSCGQVDSVMKSQFDAGYYCNPKFGGCRSKFDDSEPEEFVPNEGEAPY
jgi:hypothetical protein